MIVATYTTVTTATPNTMASERPEDDLVINENKQLLCHHQDDNRIAVDIIRYFHTYIWKSKKIFVSVYKGP